MLSNISMIASIWLLMASVLHAQELVNFELTSKARPYSLKTPTDRESRDFSMSKPGILTVFYESAPYYGGPGGHSFEKIDANGGLLDGAPTMGTGRLLEIVPKEGGTVDRRTIRHEILIHGPLPDGQKYRAWLNAWHAYQAFQIRGDGQQHAAVQKLTITFVPWDKLYDAPGKAPEIDISGKWHHGDTVTSSWHFTPASNGEYEFEEKGADNVKGKARVKGRTIFIEYTRSKDGKRNVHVITVDADGKHAPGWSAGEIFTGGDNTIWKETPVEPIRGGSDPDAPAHPADIAGTWQHGPDGETWTFNPGGPGEFTATEKGFGNGTGTATVSGDKIHIDYTTAGGKTGSYEITMAPDGKSAQGVWTESGGATGSRDFVRVGGGPGTTSPGAEPAPATEFTVQAGQRSGAPGQVVDVPIYVLQPSDVSNLNVVLEFDSAIASVRTKPKADSSLGNRLFEANYQEPGIVRVGIAGSVGVPESGPIATIPFTVTGTPGTRTPIRVSVTTANNSNDQPLTAATIEGAISVENEFTALNALEALKMSVKLLEENLKSDLDNDGRVTSNDARLILKAIVGN